MYGGLNDEQAKILAEHVQGRMVTDLGAGDLGYSRRLLELGATSVVAVDSDKLFHTPPPRIRFVHQRYAQFTEPVDVAFVSWPCNRYLQGLVQILHRADTIIYLGSNTDGSACGFTAMFEYLVFRKLLAHSPDRTNTLIVYGGPSDNRIPEREECAGLDPERWFPYEVKEEQHAE